MTGEIKPSRRLFAAISPIGKDGKRWIDYSSVRYHAKEARRAASQNWPKGWPDLFKRGWRIGHVDVIEHVPDEGVATMIRLQRQKLLEEYHNMISPLDTASQVPKAE